MNVPLVLENNTLFQKYHPNDVHGIDITKCVKNLTADHTKESFSQDLESHLPLCKLSTTSQALVNHLEAAVTGLINCSRNPEAQKKERRR